MTPLDKYLLFPFKTSLIHTYIWFSITNVSISFKNKYHFYKFNLNFPYIVKPILYNVQFRGTWNIIVILLFKKFFSLSDYKYQVQIQQGAVRPIKLNQWDTWGAVFFLKSGLYWDTFLVKTRKNELIWAFDLSK